METHVTIWHWIAAPLVLALAGGLWHLLRSIRLPLPDRLTSSPWVDSFLIPGGYRWTDYLYDTEFDEDGYYRLDSWRNLRVAVGLVLFFGMAIFICVPEIRSAFAGALDFFLQWLWERLRQRLENPW